MIKHKVFKKVWRKPKSFHQGNWASSHGEGEVPWFFSSSSGNFGYVVELRRGWPFKTCVGSVTSGLLSICEGHLGILLEVWQGNWDTSRGEAGDPGSLPSCHRDIAIPINFQEEAGIDSFWSIEFCVPLELSKGCEASCREGAGN